MSKALRYNNKREAAENPKNYDDISENNIFDDRSQKININAMIMDAISMHFTSQTQEMLKPYGNRKWIKFTSILTMFLFAHMGV